MDIDASALDGSVGSEDDFWIPMAPDARVTPVGDAAFGRGTNCLQWSPVTNKKYVTTLTDEPYATYCADWLAAAPASPTKGPAPFDGREMTWDNTPDYVPVWDRTGDGMPGYVAKYDLLCRTCDGPVTVLDESLRYVVGHMEPGRGFQPIGVQAGTPAVPCIPKAGNFHRIYDPSPSDAEPWYYNDHSFIRGRDGIWHVFAIAHAEPRNPDDERALGHATSLSLTDPTWTKQPDALVADDSLDERVLWAPHVVEHAGTYYMFYAAGGDPERHRMRLAISSDLYNWTRARKPLFEDGAFARDPFVVRIGSQWVMYYTATSHPEGGQYVIAYRTSADLLTWSNRQIAFTDPRTGTFGGPTESPYLVQRPEGYYLFVSLRNGYDSTEVFFSRDPFHFELEPQIEIGAHAPEVVRDVDGAWQISHCGWERGGLHLAPLAWDCSESSSRL